MKKICCIVLALIVCVFIGSKREVDALEGHETVHWPVVHGVNMTLATGNDLVDVTAEPFYADPSGKKDSTKAIQDAVIYARDNQKVCFFPEGEYLVSDTIRCAQKGYRLNKNTVTPGRYYPVVMQGDYAGNRPTIRLKNNSKGYGSTRYRKYVIHYYAEHLKKKGDVQPNISFNQVFKNINIIIGEGNRGAVAIRHRAAQGSFIQDVKIDCTYGFAGIEGGIGSGGSIEGVQVVGGEYGLDLRETQPACTLVNVTLQGQNKNAILYGGRQSLVAIGLKVVKNNSNPALRVNPGWDVPHHGEVCLIDSTIEFVGDRGKLIETEKGFYLNNVYIKNCSLDVDGMEYNSYEWAQIDEIAVTGESYRRHKGFLFTQNIWVGGSKVDRLISKIKSNASPPESLQLRHYSPQEFRDVYNSKFVNVKHGPYFAHGDGISDDTNALQKAIDENEVVYIPKGYYLVRDTLKLRENTKILGLAKHLSIILFDRNDKKKFQPLVETPNVKDANIMILSVGLHTPIDDERAYALKWSCGGKSVIHDVFFILNIVRDGDKYDVKSKKEFTPHVVIYENGGGRWYNYFQEIPMAGEGYRHVLIDKSVGGLSFYQFNPEHAKSDVAVEIRKSANINIYGMKAESRWPTSKNIAVLHIKDSKNINVLGYGGNAVGGVGQAVFLIQDSENVTIVNAVDTPVVVKGKRPDPDQWFMIKEIGKDFNFTTPILERPIVYKSIK
ncbi:MAG: hypothetical protein H0S80_05365 [Desulfovibrionaceae bacterium]|nr:hypothetical protein [Desulfovibrionaceae bacterium]